MKIKTINSKNHHLAEGPLWNVYEKALYWTDILEKEIWKYDSKKEETSLVWKNDLQVGGFAFTKKNDLILCSDKGVFILQKENDKPELLYEIPMSKGERFNDITTDPEGRIFAGTMEPTHSKGKLYLIENGQDPKVVLEKIAISNGMAFSPNHKIFYHTDSPKCTITKYKYEASTGNIFDPQTYYQGKPEQGFPDGITCDLDGNIWVAFWSASCIRQFNPNGELLLQIKFPATQISSLTFGGNNLDEIFVTSACEGGPDIKTGKDKNGTYLGGAIYSLPSNSIGRKEYIANF